MNLIFLLILSMLPPAGFFIYLLYMDREEPEPLGFILLVMFLGGISCIPAIIVERALEQFPLFQKSGITGAFVDSFFRIAPVEELCKLLCVLLFVWKNKNFNEENDGIVYVGTAAIGFATLENIGYVMQYGYMNAIMRAISAIPLHTFTGVLMGYYVGIGKFSETKTGCLKNVTKGFVIAWFVHGLYDAFALSKTPLALLIIPIIIALIIVGTRSLGKGRKLSLKRWRYSGPKPSNVVAIAPKTETVAGRVFAETSDNGKVSKPDGLKPHQALWKIVISRTIFTAGFIFWALLIIGFLSEPDKSIQTLTDIFVGGVILTFIPLLIGFLLEKSYRHYKNKPDVAAR